MPHVTFIHGISNKPPEKDLLRLWREAMAKGADPLPLGNLGVSSSMVYWADLMYERPDDDLASYEGVLENTAEAIDAGGGAVAPQAGSPEEREFLEGLRSKLTALPDEALASPQTPPVPANPQGSLERIPLPWPIKKAFLETFLRDVHHYLFDVTYGPPGKPAVPIQQTIRKRFIDKLGAAEITHPHVVVSHSMGTVITYDCLKRVLGCPPVDGLITIGSPLGLDEIQDKLQPGWTRDDGFPSASVSQGWTNLFDALDPVCGFDPKLANDYKPKGAERVTDTETENDGLWRHSATKYLRQPRFRSALRGLLGL
jgi:hypothetical protein